MPPAPVYRHLDAKNRLFGLSLGQAFAVGAVAFVALSALSPVGASIVTIAAYAIIRLALRGRADGFVRNWTWWTVRHLLGRGRLHAHARCRTPRFPHAPHIERDVPRRRAAHGTVTA